MCVYVRLGVYEVYSMQEISLKMSNNAQLPAALTPPLLYPAPHWGFTGGRPADLSFDRTASHPGLYLTEGVRGFDPRKR